MASAQINLPFVSTVELTNVCVYAVLNRTLAHSFAECNQWGFVGLDSVSFPERDVQTSPDLNKPCRLCFVDRDKCVRNRTPQSVLFRPRQIFTKPRHLVF